MIKFAAQKIREARARIAALDREVAAFAAINPLASVQPSPVAGAAREGHPDRRRALQGVPGVALTAGAG